MACRRQREVLNLCANNYLGLAQHPEVDRGGARGARPMGLRPGIGAVHLRHAKHPQGAGSKISEFLGTEDTILYSSCFDANGGLFETLLGAEDAVISDELNHASIIDGIRLCKAQRFRYKNNDMADLEAKLTEASAAPLPDDRHRRRLLDGRLHRQSCRPSAIWRTSTAPW